MVLLPSLAQGASVHAVVQGGGVAVHRSTSARHHRGLVRTEDVVHDDTRAF